MNTLSLRGDGARIVWGYQVAVTVGAWTVQVAPPPAPGPWIFEGALETCAVVAARQAPLTLVIPRPHGSWRWPVRSLTITNGAVTAVLGPKETSSHVPIRPAGNGQAGSQSG